MLIQDVHTVRRVAPVRQRQHHAAAWGIQRVKATDSIVNYM